MKQNKIRFKDFSGYLQTIIVIFSINLFFYTILGLLPLLIAIIHWVIDLF